MNSSLLSLFCRERDLPLFIDYINVKHNISKSKIVKYSLVDYPQEILLIFPTVNTQTNTPTATIVHRKISTDTVYTINGLNRLIMANNNGVLDKTYKIDWTLYNNKFITVRNETLTQITLQRIQ